MSRIAKGLWTRFQEQALAHDSQRRRSPSNLPGARTDLSVGRPVVRSPVDIDTRHSRAIVRAIGERLRSSLKEDRELPKSFTMQIERLRQSEEALAALDPAQLATRQHRKSPAAV